MENQLTMTLSESEARTVINALDFYSRIWIGQYDEMLFYLRWHKSRDAMDKMEDYMKDNLIRLRKILLPKLRFNDLNGSYGIFSPDRDARAGIAYDMQQEFRYKLAWFAHPEGGYSVDFGKPLACEDDIYPFPKAKCFEIFGDIWMEICICKEQALVIMSALRVYSKMNSGDIKGMFDEYIGNDVDKDAYVFINKVHNAINDMEDDPRSQYDSSDIERIMGKLESRI